MTKRGRTIISLALMALGGLWTLMNGLVALLMLLIPSWSGAPWNMPDGAGIAATVGAVIELIIFLLPSLAGLIPLWFGYRLWKRRSLDRPLFGRNEE